MYGRKNPKKSLIVDLAILLFQQCKRREALELLKKHDIDVKASIRMLINRKHRRISNTARQALELALKDEQA